MDLQSVDFGVEAMGAGDLALHGADAGAEELDDPAAVGAQQVVVLLAGVDVLEEEARAAQALLAYEAELGEQLEVAVEGGARDFEPFALDGVEQAVGVDVAVLAVDLAKERHPLGGHPPTAGAQTIAELGQLGEVVHDLGDGWPAISIVPKAR